MSYDVNMVVDSGGEYPASVYDCGNYTYNISPMYYDAFYTIGLKNGLNSLEGTSGIAAIDILEKVISILAHPDNRKKYEAMNPENNWGSLKGGIKYLEAILEGCREHPKATIHIS